MGRAVTAPVYFDANAIIRLLEHRDAPLLRLLDRMKERAAAICTSEISLAEVLVVPLREKDRRLIDSYETFLRGSAGIVVASVSRNVLRLSAELRATMGGKSPDAIHVATAMLNGCKLVVSSDQRLRVAPDIRRVAIEDLDGLADLP